LQNLLVNNCCKLLLCAAETNRCESYYAVEIYLVHSRLVAYEPNILQDTAIALQKVSESSDCNLLSTFENILDKVLGFLVKSAFELDEDLRRLLQEFSKRRKNNWGRPASEVYYKQYFPYFEDGNGKTKQSQRHKPSFAGRQNNARVGMHENDEEVEDKDESFCKVSMLCE